MHRHPERYGISEVEALLGQGRKGLGEFRFQTDHGLTREEVDQYFRELARNKVIFEKDLWEGYGFRLYREEA